MKLRQKLASGFIAIVLLCGAAGYISIRYSTYAGTIFNDIERTEVPSLMALLEMKTAVQQASIEAMEYSVRGGERPRLNMQEAIRNLEGQQKHFNNAKEGDNKTQRLINEKVEAFKSEIGRYLALSAAPSPDVSAKEEGVKEAGKDLIQTLYSQIEKQQRELKEAELKTKKAIASTIRITLFSVFGVICLALGIGLFVSYSISAPIIKLKNAAVEIGRGSLPDKIEIGSRDEIGELAASIDHMISGLKELERLKIDRNDLEKTVNKRTYEIEEAMAVLEAGTHKLNRSQTAMLYMIEDLNRQSLDLRNAQDAIVRSEKLAAIGQLASSVAHELRNPLGVMKNVVYYFNMLELGKHDVDIKENLDILAKEIETSDKIISDILEFTRIKKPALRFEKINLVLEDTLKRLKIGPGVKVVKDFADDLPDIEVDAMQLQQIFTNIAQNAMQSMDNAGSLGITTGVNGDFIEAAFADTGIGISEKDIGKIFDPLFSNKVNGTGLGLSVCASLVEGHGGMIDVVSELGKGTIFTVKLPIKRG